MWLRLIVTAATAAVLGGTAAQPPAGAFSLGVIRRDGFVVPFASFDGTKWRNDWPQPKADVEVPVTLDAVPSRWWGPVGPRETWEAWVGEEPPRPIQVRQLDWYDAHCLRQIGLRTDYRSRQPAPRPESQPYPKDGLAVSPAIPIERIAILPPGETPDPVVTAFDMAEDKATSRRGAMLPPDQKRPAPHVEAVYAIDREPSSRVYYFEAVREYKRIGGGCQLLLAGAGWFVREGSAALKVLEFEAAVVPCNRYGMRYMLPLGAVRTGSGLFWIAQWSGWDHEDYRVVDIKKNPADVLRVWGGGC